MNSVHEPNSDATCTYCKPDFISETPLQLFISKNSKILDKWSWNEDGRWLPSHRLINYAYVIPYWLVADRV